MATALEARSPTDRTAPMHAGVRVAAVAKSSPVRQISFWERIPPFVLVRLASRPQREESFEDFLTSLPNRAAMQVVLQAYSESVDSLALLIIGIDRFKDFNDLEGHDAGDSLLREIGDQLASVLGATEFVARVGGDEFALILPGVRNSQDLQSSLQRFQSVLKRFLQDSSSRIGIRASIGGAVFREHTTSATELVKFAYLALNEAKRLGGGRAELFRYPLRRVVQLRCAMRSRAAACLTEPGRLQVHFQPKVDLRTNLPVGYEALLRCVDARGRLRGPSWISAAFEDATLAIAIGEKVRRKSFAATGELLGEMPGGRVAINVSEWELRRPEWPHEFLRDAERAGLSPNSLEVEVTESVLLGKTAKASIAALEFLHSKGVTITLDDFGTGFASLSHLRLCPIDVLKIDRSFTSNLSDPDDGAIVRAIIELGSALRMTIIAEGIETSRQHDLLKSWGCHQGQGYLYGQATSVASASRAIAKAKVGCTGASCMSA